MLIRHLFKFASTIILICLPSFSAQAIDLKVKNTSQQISQSLIAQVDVRPTDYWFSAVQSLTERYGISMFYSDRTFRGNRQISQNELVSYVRQGFQVVQRINPSADQYSYAASMRGILDACKSRYGNVLSRGAFAVCFDDGLNDQVRQASSAKPSRVRADFESYCRKTYLNPSIGTNAWATLNGRTVYTWTCDQRFSNGQIRQNAIDVNQVCISQTGSPKHGFTNQNDPHSWYCGS
ncbi:S-layer homology domain-containing protein [Pseudanabaena sp. FACHB-1277]|uniref:S-layer homology domain-containing protein n=1 Tax=Pseudanabaena cinerea FACHB-1277 TaxID=2949581 RepID=A0A926UXK3_9CYAN|nr:S-layer homology domain-containing protein [Pseudanabaena cinerea]MBD2152828.1 S-layer homology domain-containing protein [Pseudanabaena cinerea FACHB-1277]